jgi:hypothetical protein
MGKVVLIFCRSTDIGPQITAASNKQRPGVSRANTHWHILSRQLSKTRRSWRKAVAVSDTVQEQVPRLAEVVILFKLRYRRLFRHARLSRFPFYFCFAGSAFF